MLQKRTKYAIKALTALTSSYFTDLRNRKNSKEIPGSDYGGAT
ncbi:MAG: hypothetical protein K0S32_3859 [Bacteroidetes bacterium]|nr:hypothetical protein [Bacteroidota bacterium]